MSLGKKILVVLVISFFAYGSYRVYRHLHPKVLPPPSAREEVTLTIIPGWNLRQVAEYLVLKGFASTTDDVYKLTGRPADVKADPPALDKSVELEELRRGSYEGYLAPETYRVYRDATLASVLEKMVVQRQKELLPDRYNDARASIVYLQYPNADHDVIPALLTMASLVEEEARTTADRKMVADILWRRVQARMPLQLDSTVHYAIDKMGDVYTTEKERAIDSLWNTYKYPGLPFGPISTPSLESIDAVIHPTKNGYWYFLTGKDGKMYYAKTLEEHNANKVHL